MNYEPFTRIENPVIHMPISHLYICREPSTNQLLFMQNKPNFQNAKNERKLICHKGLQKKRLFSTPKNKPNSKPISRTPKCTKNNLPDIPATPFCILLKVPYTLHSQIMAKRTMRVSWPDYQGLYRFATFMIMGLGG